MVINKIFSERPWGSFTQYTQNQQTTVKIIVVNPGEKLSVQRHKLRDELWIALDPNLVYTVDGKSDHLYSEVFIPKGKIHTIENRGYDPARFLEISFGEFREEDIERLEDRYGRV